jgi:hypothetical protein
MIGWKNKSDKKAIRKIDGWGQRYKRNVLKDERNASNNIIRRF